jgi:hypothetical protein
MLKLIEVEPKGGNQLALRFSDGAAGVFDFAPFVYLISDDAQPAVA